MRKTDKQEDIMYPNPLITAKTLPVPEHIDNVKDPKLISYAKHYYASTALAQALAPSAYPVPLAPNVVWRLIAAVRSHAPTHRTTYLLR